MPVVQVNRSLKRYGLLLLEWLVLFWFGVAALLYSVLEVPMRDPLELYFERIWRTVPCYLVVLLVVLLLIRLNHLRQGRREQFLVPHRYTWDTFREHYLSKSALIYDFRLINAVSWLFVAFVNLKHLIPFINPSLYDAQLMNTELSLFRGEIAAAFLHASISTEFAPLLSTAYTLFYAYVAFLIYFFVICRAREYAHHFFVAFLFVWFGGIVIVYLLPTQGPIFFKPELFSHLPFTEVSDMQQKLLLHAQALERDPLHPHAIYLISGLPSLHMAIPLLGAIWLWPLSRGLSILSWSFAAITAVTTIYFGWHWILDDIAAVVLVIFVTRAVRRFLRPVLIYVREVPKTA